MGQRPDSQMLQRREYARSYYHERKASDPDWIANRVAKRNQWREENKERVREANREWKKANPRKVLDEIKRRRFRRRVTDQAALIAEEVRHRARCSGVECDLTRQWAEARWTGKCEVTGIEFIVSRGKPNPRSASVDRIDPRGGYTQDNCRFVIWAVNRFKGEDSDEVMIEIARAIVARNSN